MTTIALTAIFVLLFTGSLLLSAALLRIGLILVRAENIRWPADLTIVLIAAVINAILAFATVAVSSFGSSVELVAAVIQLICAVAVPCVLIRKLYRVTFPRAFCSWLPTLLCPILFIPFSVYILGPYVMESFSAPTSSMAPTLVGPHVRAKCPVCGARAFMAPPDRRMGTSIYPRYAICETHFHTSIPQSNDAVVQPADRFMTLKLLRPKRWDVITFRLPFAPEQIYVKRLVGLPGEKIVIKDGGVWANDERLEPPAELKGLQYLSEIEEVDFTLSGTERRPAYLLGDEYFVLGDFSQHSADARFWTAGAPGHHSYAVPEDHLLGVVTHIYWPPSRWRILK